MFNKTIEIQTPRLLSQSCRDENSPFYGCFDRNWWHYRIRDFSSIMLQQGGYTAYQCSLLPEFKEESAGLQSLAQASAIFWNTRAKRRGAFEEYYPWEQGYPPLAFATLAMAKLVLDGLVEKDEIIFGLRKAAKQLEKRFEYQAGNQQVAGLAALACIRKIDPTLVREENYLSLKEKTLKLQNSEGWYTEYDGPDLGYLSVTLDCLWDLYDVTDDKDYLRSAEKGLDFLYGFISRKQGGAGMFNARNTDYIVPYGISRFLKTGDYKLKSSYLLSLLYKGQDKRAHFFHAIDDRYWSHYIGHSVVRAQVFMNVNPFIAHQETVSETIKHRFENSGYLFREIAESESCLLVAGKKGGVFSIYAHDKEVNDFGWIIVDSKKQYVNHWWSDSWHMTENENELEISGKMFPHSEKTSTPFLHFGLRLVSFIFGSRLTSLLRNVLIFKSKASNITFNRKITFSVGKVVVKDKFSALGKNVEIRRAPRASKRHVASADSYHKDDFMQWHEDGFSENFRKEGDKVCIDTVYKT